MGKENEGKKTVQIPVEVHYLEMVLPPRCRNHRYRENATMVNVEVEAFSGDEAPVALITKVHKYRERWVCTETPYRLANGKLYTPCDHLKDAMPIDDPNFRAFCWYSSWLRKTLCYDDAPFIPKEISKDLPEWTRFCGAEQEHVEVDSLRSFFAECIIVDGYLWKESSEPAYEVNTLWHPASIEITDRRDCSAGFEDSFLDCSYDFNANQRNEAVEWIQKHWNDSDEPDFDHMDKIEVLIPESVALPTKAERECLHDIGKAVKCANILLILLERTEYFGIFGQMYNLAAELETQLRIKLEPLAERWKRGCAENPITEDSGWLEQSVEAAYQELVS